MPVNLSIKNVPDELAADLRARAARNHRSLQGELMAILEQAVVVGPRLSARDVLREVRALRVTTDEESARILRAERDAR